MWLRALRRSGDALLRRGAACGALPLRPPPAAARATAEAARTFANGARRAFEEYATVRRQRTQARTP
jgi:hypothetical protein